MNTSPSMSTRWLRFRPTKTALFWTNLGTLVLTMVIGFTFGGWMSARGAETMASEAVYAVRSNLGANLCIERFSAATTAESALVAFKALGSWEQRDAVRKGGWAKIADLGDASENTVSLCAERLVALELKQPLAAR